ncbi:MAG: 3-isopropylmalate dehydratase small subunit [SAR324 cluster bacterium]|nr:3-isopropylmalate dehydratase small subunit [SAR324 cluster bacterium]
MEPFKTFTALAALMNRVNVDTDTIIPKQFLVGVDREGMGRNAFYDWRYLDGDQYKPNPEFELNLPRYEGARILVTGDNFVCGSSREHAPWSLTDYGFKTIISTSFADIFYNNSLKNGLLPAVVSPRELKNLMAAVQDNVGLEITVNLEERKLTTSTGLEINFQIEDHARQSLVRGLDDVGITMQFEDKITEFEARSKEKFPWLG